MTSFLKSTTDAVRDAAQQGAHGVQSVARAAGDAAQLGGHSEAAAGATATENDAQSDQPSSNPPPHASDSTQSQAGHTQTGLVGGLTGGFQTAGTALSAGLQSGAGLVGDATKTGLAIGEKVAKTGADVTGNVLVGTVGLAGTALGGVVSAAAESSGRAFEPVAAGLRSIEGLEGLADNLEKINGLPMAAVKQVGAWTVQAINMAGKTPTFFDRDGDGVVQVQDTIDGLIVLGLADKSATYAAYALHGVFSYSTSDSWIPSKDTALPIHITKMNDTRWGRNWGNFDRIEWCSDMDVETFFETAGEDTGTLEKWKKTITKGRQGFGVLLLIFEWGTTWPWLMPDVPVADIPFRDDIGRVVRTVILPTIFKNWQIAHGITPNQDSEPVAKKKSFKEDKK